MKTASGLITTVNSAFRVSGYLLSIFFQLKIFFVNFTIFLFFQLESLFSGISVNVTWFLISERRIGLTFFHFLPNVAFRSLQTIFFAFFT